MMPIAAVGRAGLPVIFPTSEKGYVAKDTCNVIFLSGAAVNIRRQQEEQEKITLSPYAC